ncbi:hypothetical protein F4820DRAFT_418445 [Hypoxylon rubiginosum]|uniref:Uncharacterized protein n=1 Tax=Hypoxylon rubiginosum TaxID=110542 RepID=A0ACB9Z477_9PEZI|nr:hypothetical protein F4820DRAFT_418445 [Hypoxylon rubiginosum]
MAALKEEYANVLEEKAAIAFSDGKASFDYQREKFSSVLANFCLPDDVVFMTELLDAYETTFKSSLRSPGAVGRGIIIHCHQVHPFHTKYLGNYTTSQTRWSTCTS